MKVIGRTEGGARVLQREPGSKEPVRVRVVAGTEQTIAMIIAILSVMASSP